MPVEDQILSDNTNLATAQSAANAKYSTGGWGAVATILSSWGDTAPTLPVGSTVGLSHAGVDPYGPMGQQIINKAVPQMPGATHADPGTKAPASTMPHGLAPQGLKDQPGQAPEGLMGDPSSFKSGTALNAPQHQGGGILGDIEGAAKDVGGALGSAASGVERDAIQPINRVIGGATSAATGGAASSQQVEAGFAAQDPKAAIRTGFSAMNAGQTAFHVATNLLQIAPPTPGPLSSFGLGGGVQREGSLSDKLNPHQFALYNQLTGESSGSGFLPGGPAAVTAAQAATQAASIDYNGKEQAYTLGRGLASSVFTPGSRPYSVASGITDAIVSFYDDPSAAALKEFSAERALGSTFTATPEEAYNSAAEHFVTNANTSDQVAHLRDWTGASVDATPDLREAIIDKLKTDPGSATKLTQGDDAITTPKALLKAIGMNSLGASTFLRRHVDQPFALKFLNSQAGNDFAQKIADSPSFTDIWHMTNKQLPVNLVSGLANATKVEDVKFYLASELGTTMTKTPGFGWLRPLEDVRMLHALPDAADITDNQQMVEQAERHLIAGNVPRDQWDNVLQPVADARTPDEIKNAYINGVGDTIAKNLTDNYGVSAKHAKQLTKFFADQSETDRQYAIDQLGNTPHLPGVVLDGKSVPITGPHQTNELLNRVIPALDPRKLTQASTRYRAALHLWDNQGKVGGGIEGFSHFLDSITSTWKGATLAHPSVMLRALADSQLAMTSEGMDTFLNHPIKYLGMVTAKHAIPGTGKTLQHDFLGNDWLDEVHNYNSDIAKSLGYGEAGFRPQSTDSGRLLLKNYVHYGKDSPEYNRSWAGEISQLATNPVTRELARAVRDPGHLIAGVGKAADDEVPMGVDAVKQAFWDGPLSGERMTLANAKLEWGSENLADNRAWSDAYVDSELQRLMTKTSGAAEGKVADPDLIDAVADGTPFRKPGKVERSFTDSLDDKVEQFGPVKVKGQMVAPKSRVAGWDRAVGWAFSKLMDEPIVSLVRSPTFRQAYAQKAPELLPFMTGEGQEQFIREAADAGVTLKAVSQTGDLSAEDANQILKAHALEQTKKMLYYPGERVGATDKLRAIAPFADAWRRVLSRWAGIASAHPQIIRRGQQGVTALQQNGFFHPDPAQGGKEVFTLIPGGLMKAVAGAPFPVTGAVSGLNIAGQGLPGIGPAVTVGVAPLLSMFHSVPAEALRDKVFPYGLPDTGGGILESLFPGWLDKTRAAGKLAHIPFLGELPSQRENTTMADLTDDIFSYKVSAGTVNMHDVDSIQRGWSDAGHEANTMYMYLGLAQFVAPAAPNLQRDIQLKNGSVVETYLLAQDYSKMLQSSDGDSYKATLQFIQKYGPERIFATQRKSQTLVYGLGTGPESQAFTASHAAFAQKFPNVYGLWAPTIAQTQRGSYQDWLDSIVSGQTKPLSVEDWTHLAESRVANAAYNEARKQLGVSPDAAQQTWLSQVKAKLTAQYPGFGMEIGTAKLNTAQKIAEISGAVQNKDAPKGDETTAVKLYLSVRNQALAEASARGYKTLGGQSVADLRSWLFEAGTKIAQKFPVFTNTWNQVFQDEVNPS